MVLWGFLGGGRAILCIVGCLAASLASIPGGQQQPSSSPIPSCDNQMYLQTLPTVPWGGGVTKLPLAENHCARSRGKNSNQCIWCQGENSLRVLLTCLYSTQTHLLRLISQAHLDHFPPSLIFSSHIWNALSPLHLLSETSLASTPIFFNNNASWLSVIFSSWFLSLPLSVATNSVLALPQLPWRWGC